MHEDVFFFGISKGVPVGTAHGSTGRQQPESPWTRIFKKTVRGGGFISIRKYQDSDNATFVKKFVLCEKVAYLAS